MAGQDVQVPAVKGTLFAAAIEELDTLLEAGRVCRDELEVRLEAEDLEHVGSKPEPDAWYAIASYARLREIADDKRARRRREDLVEQGRRAFKVLSGRGEYQEIASRIEDWGGRFGFFGITIWSSFYNFMRWEFEETGRPGIFEVIVSEARELPESERYRIQGFIEAHTRFATGGPASVSSERTTPAQIVFNVIAERFRRPS
jgi:hypothetical protein